MDISNVHCVIIIIYKCNTYTNIFLTFIGSYANNVSEIALMALDLLRATIVFKIPHMPNSRLQLRMGIHTGPAIGVVSGSNTPKYWYESLYLLI